MHKMINAHNPNPMVRMEGKGMKVGTGKMGGAIDGYLGAHTMRNILGGIETGETIPGTRVQERGENMSG